MIPGELIELQERFYEDDIIFLTTKAEHVAEHFSVDLSVMLKNEKESFSQDWNLEVTGYQKSNFNFEPAYEMKLETDHPLLWEFTHQYTELHYTGKVAESFKLLYDLYAKHASLFKTSVPFSLLKNNEQQFAFTNGLLARGPRMLMIKYGEVLQQHGLEYNISLNDDHTVYPPFDDEQLQVLLLGDSFVVGEKFKFRRVG